jgi:hypothetical protein
MPCIVPIFFFTKMMPYDVINLKMFSKQTIVANIPMFVLGFFFFLHINVIFLHLIHINTNNKFVLDIFSSKYSVLLSLKYHFKLY